MALDRRVSDVTVEARDNFKYLSALDQYLWPLYSPDFGSDGNKELLPNPINSIKIILTISKNYKTSEKMTSLFVKVAYQMIGS